jgi:hypothetical protein
MDEGSRKPLRFSPAQLRALYAAAVAGLLTFFLTALFFPAPIQSYRARAVVQQTAQVGDQAPLEMQLLTQEQVQKQAEASYQAIQPGKNAFADAVACQVERPTPSQVRITIETSDRYADRSLALCRRIADDLVDIAATSFVPGIERLRSERANVEQRLALLRQSKRIAEDELTELSHEHVSSVTAAVQGTTAAAQAAAPVSIERERLTALRQELLTERGELARTKTEQHPQIKEIDVRVAELQNHLDSLPPPTPAQSPLDGMQAEYRRRSQELTDVIAEYRRREEELLAQADQLAITPAPIALSSEIVESPQVIDRLGGQPSGFQVVVLILLSVTAGGLTYRLLRQWSAQQKFQSAEDIQEQLELPVVALNPADGPSCTRLLRRSLLAAELSLATVAALVFLLVMLQPELSRPISSDPWGAVAESLDRTFATTLRR